MQDGRAEWSYVEHRPLLSNFCKLPVAAVPPVILSSVVHQLMSASPVSLTSSPPPITVADTR